MNQREIKFRCFDTKLKKIFLVQSMDWKNKVAWAVEPQGLSILDPVLMQFTGLKDKNGKEIYEGDVVQLSNGKVAEVLFYEKKLKFCKRIVGRKGCSGLIAESHGFHGEIIGNIYENPELLKI